MHAAHKALQSRQQLKNLLTSEAACKDEGRAATAIQKPGTGSDDRKRSQTQQAHALAYAAQHAQHTEMLLPFGLGLPGYVQPP